MRNLSLLSFLLLFGFGAFAQTSIKGQIVNSETNEPLVGASIHVENTTNGTASDFEGKFEITVGDEDIVLVFSFVGYKNEKRAASYFQVNNIVSLSPNLNLESVTVTGTFNRRNDFPLNPHSFRSEINKSPLFQGIEPSNILSALQGLPGIQAQQGALNTNRLIVRGLGTRTPFSTDQVKVYFGDIPLTNGIGESAAEELEADAISHISLQSGVGNYSIGSELGGTLTVGPSYYRGNQDSTRVALSGSFTGGSFGRNRQSLGLHLLDKSRSLSNQLLVSRTHSDGYRANNNYERRSAYLLGQYRKSTQKTSLNYLFHYRSLEAGIPSSLNINDFNEKPRAAAFNWASVSGNEDANAYLGGLTFRKFGYENGFNFKATAFAGGSDNFEIRPFNVLEEDSRFYGMRGELGKNLSNGNSSMSHGLKLGGEWRDEVYDQNLYETLDGGLVGNQFNQLTENRFEWFSYLSYYYHSNNNKLFVDASLTLRERRFEWSGTSLMEDEPFVIPMAVLPSFRLMYLPGKARDQALTFFVGKGLSLANGEESLTAASFGNILNPETGWNKEIGYELYKGRTRLNVRVFHLNVKDALVNRQTIDGQNYLENAGSTIHQGVEILVRGDLWNPHYNKKFTAEASYTFGDYRFDTFEENSNNYSGNLLPGVPQHTLRLKGILEWNELNLQVTHLFNNEMPVNDGNTEFSDAYSILNFRAAYFFPLGEASFDDKRRRIEVFAAVNNIFDAHYAAMVQVNARGFGGNLPRYYYPGLPRYYYVGIALPLR